MTRRQAKAVRWHTHIGWRSGAGFILVNGGYTSATLKRRQRIARQLARWAWGGLPGEWKPAPTPDARQRGAMLGQYREAG